MTHDSWSWNAPCMPRTEKPPRSGEVRLTRNLPANQEHFWSVHNLLLKFPTFIVLVLKCHLRRFIFPLATKP